MAAEGEPVEMNYIPEVILKKRKSSEEMALRRKAQLELRQKRNKLSKANDFKTPEQFIREYRDKEIDLVRMKHRVKRSKPNLSSLDSRLIFVVRIQGKNDMHPKTVKLLNKLRLRRVFTGTFLRVNEGVMEMLKKVEPYVTYGYPNLNNVRELILKKGFARIEGERVPLTDNTIIEQQLGKLGIVCLEDMVHEIANVGPHFKEVASFLWPFNLNKPAGGIRRTKLTYKDGGETGDRGEQINELISKMN
ncbi:hypothetical protein MLD38_028329 [Melastoma candidum]|uniref:Uncharacterized protein n=1 Tax=Melastoma candidum TaxID=119954 RepID=A0ACB9N1K1_9MYRT|nr:hypothetical protein MLD38_028329 [Melastoma candidum]